ncbi:hydroxyacid dehydrogenase [Streptomyces sp. 8P21H-1]|uniref:hydroxyacid dehydrogenase n=1 Tax=Streptomyces sp. 8P21H-1 TaxID=2737048 RepID=UPI00156E052F|nr:hydroxyacid dehydrogenase [Streptomyces sp. 8P21H-1]NSL42697.1 hydroxyacid dehydrogenase [Streptomyces sp. 8P21H-1]
MTDSAYRPRAALAMSPEAATAVFTPGTLDQLATVCDLAPLPVLDDFTTARAREVLAEVDLLVTGWRCPPLDMETLAAAPQLRAVVHSAGTVRGHITDACWERGIEVSSAAAANALPVAEYTLAMILLTGKQVLERARAMHLTRTRTPLARIPHTLGNHRRTVGILSASLIGRRVIELLRAHDIEILLYDPYLTDAEATELGCTRVELQELFTRSDTVSVHTPLLPATRGLVSRTLIESMRPGAILINTARGAVVDQDAIADAAAADHIRAVLDVTDPELLPPEHPMWDCDNVLITPHLAGSEGNEWHRLAEHAVAETARWASGEGFLHPVRRERLAYTA